MRDKLRFIYGTHNDSQIMRTLKLLRALRSTFKRAEKIFTSAYADPIYSATAMWNLNNSYLA